MQSNNLLNFCIPVLFYFLKAFSSGLRDYQVKENGGDKAKTGKPSGRMIQRVRNAYKLLMTEKERLSGKKELLAALAEVEKTQKGDLVKQLDKVIGYKGNRGNDGRKKLCEEFLIIWDADFVDHFNNSVIKK